MELKISGLNKCSFCPHGISDDQGSRCGVVGILSDPETMGLVKRTIESDCGNAQRRYEERMHHRTPAPVVMLIA